MRKFITHETLLDEENDIETIPDLDFLKKILRKVLDNSSYTNCKREGVLRIVNEIYDVYDKEY